jgi:hypothetical protein
MNLLCGWHIAATTGYFHQGADDVCRSSESDVGEKITIQEEFGFGGPGLAEAYIVDTGHSDSPVPPRLQVGTL